MSPVPLGWWRHHPPASGSTPISFTLIEGDANSLDGTSFGSTGSLTGTNGHMCIAAFSHSVTSASITDASSISGAAVTGMTKIKTHGFQSTASPIKNVEIWVGKWTGSASTVTLNFGATQTAAIWAYYDVTGADTTQGTGGVIQSVADSNASASNAAFTITLASFGHTQNRGFAVGANSNTNTISMSGTSPYAELTHHGITTPSFSQSVIADTTDSGVTAAGTWSSSGQWGGVAIEIAGS